MNNAKWPPGIFELVDWDAQHQASRKIKRDNHLTFCKLDFGLFAMMGIRQRHQKEIDPSCPHCTAVTKSFDYALQCPSVALKTAVKWQEAKKNILTPSMCPAVINCFERGLLAWFNGSDPATIVPKAPDKDGNTIGDLIYRAFLDQNKIGWGQAVRGQISREWARAQSTYQTARYNSTESPSTKWAENMVFQLWKFGISRWIDRNEYIYGRTGQEKAHKRNSKINLKITSAFLFDRRKVRHEDSHLFDLPKEERLCHTWEQKRLWLPSINAAIIARTRA